MRDFGHRGYHFTARRDLVRAVVFVLDQHAIDAFVHERVEIGKSVPDQCRHARMPFEARKGRQVDDADDRF